MGCLQWLTHLVCLFSYLLNFEAANSKSISSNISSSIQWCPHEESLALLQFAKSFSINASVTGFCVDPVAVGYPKTKSWKEEKNCCSWDGVTCDIHTGHVIGLDLSCSMLQGHFHPNNSLFLLPHLQKIDLSNNDFNYSNISAHFGQFLNLTHLNLKYSNFAGQVPAELSRLSRLVSLDLSKNFYLEVQGSTFDRLVQNLTKLREVNLNGIDMSLVTPSSLMNLSTSLLSLRLQVCRLKGELPQDIFQRPTLQMLDLMGNTDLTGSFAPSNGSVLQYLDLSWSKISVSLDNYFTTNLRSLNYLHLKDCNLVKSNLELLGNLTHLTDLDLSETDLSGRIPSSFANLKKLTFLDMSTNNFRGPIPSFLGSLTQLVLLYLSTNNFIGKIPVEFANLTQLYDLELSNNQLIGPLPYQLSLIPSLSGFDVSNNLLAGTIRSLFSGNMGELPYNSLWYINLSNNKLQGPIPSSFSKFINLKTLILSSNKLEKEIPSSICKLKSLRILDLSNNSLSSSLPQCLGNFSNHLSVLRLNRNNFQGDIPLTFPEGSSLQYINIYGNELAGKIPTSVINCTNLEILDLGNNRIEDTFPFFIGTLSKLKVLALRSNKLQGSIKIPSPAANFYFPKLQIFDVSNNSLSGDLPIEFFKCLNGMIDVDKDFGHGYLSTNNYPFAFFYDYSIEVTSKRLQMELAKIQTMLVIIDLSCNRFTGRIPNSIGDLKSLIVLNVSHNRLGGSILPSLGNLTNLESLDLSSNSLSGEIPGEMVNLIFLQVLNLSFNQLEGKIPQGKQFNTFESSSYEGNSGLCGFPLLKLCSSDETKQLPPFHEEDDSASFFEIGWQVVMMGYGCGLIFGLAMAMTAFKTRKPLWLMRIVERNYK